MAMATLTQSAGNMSTLEFLRFSPCFVGLDNHVLEKINRLMVERRVDKHEIIWLEQEPAKMVYFNASGLIKLFRMSTEGKEQILRLVRPGDCFGYPGMFNGGSNPESAQALVPSVLYGLMKSDLEALLQDYEQLAINTIRALATETHHYMSLVGDLSLRRVSGRLAKMLLEHSNEGIYDTSLFLTQENMAAMTGTVREVIGKSIKALEEKGAIRADNRKIIIEDSNALKIIAGLV
jgi:CRP-like cAMP-binding protein